MAQRRPLNPARAEPGRCAHHSGLTERIAHVAFDVAEIKVDVKALVTAQAAERGFRLLGRAFAAGLGVATPLGALVWALFNN